MNKREKGQGWEEKFEDQEGEEKEDQKARSRHDLHGCVRSYLALSLLATRLVCMQHNHHNLHEWGGIHFLRGCSHPTRHKNWRFLVVRPWVAGGCKK